MGRKHINTITQPSESTCGPVAIKHALEVFGKKRSLPALIKLCKTSRNGTSTPNMIRALTLLGFSVLSVEKANLHHLTSALKSHQRKTRAVIVSYLYARDDNNKPWDGSGHWAMVSGFSPRRSRIILLDSYSGKKKSYEWQDFRQRWKDFDLKRRKLASKPHTYKIFRKWQKQLMLIITKDPKYLPKFSIQTARHFST